MQTKEHKQSHNTSIKRLTDKTEYTVYRKSVPSKFRVKGRDYYNKIVREYYKTIAEMMTEYTGGVCVDKCFYLFYYKIPKKMGYVFYKGGSKYYNPHTDNHIYAITIMFPPQYNYWSLRKGSFPVPLKKKLGSLLRAGHKFKTHFNSLKTIKKI